MKINHEELSDNDIITSLLHNNDQDFDSEDENTENNDPKATTNTSDTKVPSASEAMECVQNYTCKVMQGTLTRPSFLNFLRWKIFYSILCVPAVVKVKLPTFGNRLSVVDSLHMYTLLHFVCVCFVFVIEDV